MLKYWQVYQLINSLLKQSALTITRFVITANGTLYFDHMVSSDQSKQII